MELERIRGPLNQCGMKRCSKSGRHASNENIVHQPEVRIGDGGQFGSPRLSKQYVSHVASRCKRKE